MRFQNIRSPIWFNQWTIHKNMWNKISQMPKISWKMCAHQTHRKKNGLDHFQCAIIYAWRASARRGYSNIINERNPLLVIKIKMCAEAIKYAYTKFSNVQMIFFQLVIFRWLVSVRRLHSGQCFINVMFVEMILAADESQASKCEPQFSECAERMRIFSLWKFRK